MSAAGGGALVRVLAPGDRDAVIALWREAFPNDPGRNEPAAYFDRKAAMNDGLVWVAEADGAVIGVIVAGYDGVRGWLYHLAVTAERRRGGVGRALVEAALAELEARGCPKVNLQVRATNAAVIAFYERLGFEVDPNVGMGRVL